MCFLSPADDHAPRVATSLTAEQDISCSSKQSTSKWVSSFVLSRSGQSNDRKENDVASTGDSAIPVTQWESTCASAAASPRNAKIRLINDDPYRIISDIKLKRTDTTLDLSQKAVKNVC
jgi:hypothetical protein